MEALAASPDKVWTALTTAEGLAESRFAAGHPARYTPLGYLAGGNR